MAFPHFIEPTLTCPTMGPPRVIPRVMRRADRRGFVRRGAARAGSESRLAETADRWWPEIEAFLWPRVTNARTEGSNRILKQIKHVECGYGNQANYERPVVLGETTRVPGWIVLRSWLATEYFDGVQHRSRHAWALRRVPLRQKVLRTE